MKFFFSLFFLSFSSQLLAGPVEQKWISMRFKSFTSNAGGQNAFAASYSNEKHEYTVFSNQNLQTENYPLTGGIYSWRFLGCEKNCMWNFYGNVGGGISNGGPMAEVLVGVMVPIVPVWFTGGPLKYVPYVRLDFGNQFFASRHRVITWSYPLWLGLAFSF